MTKAKIFINGKSQAVRLPKKFKFSVEEVSISSLGNGIVLQPISRRWRDVFAQLNSIESDPIIREDSSLQERDF